MPSQRVSAKQRRTIVERARDCCEHCRSQARYSTQSFSVEHILPRDKGGPTALENLALACQGCNNYKHVKTEAYDPVNKVFAPLYNPRRQQWHDHFAWDHQYSLVVGLYLELPLTVRPAQRPDGVGRAQRAGSGR